MVQQLHNKIVSQQAKEEYKKQKENLNPAQKYASTRDKIMQSLKQKDYWPDTMKHPENYRSFYWTDDMTFCGFATMQHQGKTIDLIKQAKERSKKLKPRRRTPKNSQKLRKTTPIIHPHASQPMPNLANEGQ